MGDWETHIKAVTAMLPFFAASGQHLYLKSECAFLQKMRELQIQNPDLWRLFTEDGLHVIRRSEKMWCGIAADLSIEQTLMRSIKSTGGLTRGRGMNEVSRSVWLLSTPVTSEVSDKIRQVTNVDTNTGAEHTERSESRRNRDISDAKQVAWFLHERNVFCTEDSSLQNLETGEVIISLIYFANLIMYNSLLITIIAH